MDVNAGREWSPEAPPGLTAAKTLPPAAADLGPRSICAAVPTSLLGLWVAVTGLSAPVRELVEVIVLEDFLQVSFLRVTILRYHLKTRARQLRFFQQILLCF